MKYLLILMLAFTQAMAFEVPKDAVIKVYDSKGKLIGNMSRKQYKVVSLDSHQEMVPRADYDALLQENRRSVGKMNDAREANALNRQKLIENERKSHNVKYSAILSGGVGDNGLDYSRANNSNYSVREHLGLVGMGQLCATKDGVGLCASAAPQSNFYGLGLKFDFGESK